MDYLVSKGKEEIERVFGLSFSLAVANFNLRNEGSYLGVFWYLLSPLVMFIIILFIKNVAFSSAPILYYPLYLIVGLTLFNFFTQLIAESTQIILENSNLVKNINFPHESLVISKIIQGIFSHFFEYILVILMFLYFNVSLLGLIMYPFLFLLFSVFTLGVMFITAVIGAYINDLKNVWVIVSQILFFITPIFYVVNPSEKLYFINFFNPVFYFITIIRDVSIYNKIPPVKMISFSFLLSVLSLSIGYYVFRKYKTKFAELV